MLFFFVLNVFAQSGEKNITLTFSDIPLSEAIKRIEKTSKYTFFYDALKIDLTQKVSLKANNISVKDAVGQMLSGSNIRFEITNSQIALYKGEESGSKKNKQISGVVTDKNGDPVIGATIMVDDTRKGTVSDINGSFKLEVPEDGKINVSFIGYVSRNINVKGETFFRVKLQEGATALDELVVIGYGTIQKSDLTGAVSSLKDENSEEKPFSTVEQMIQGRVAGVQITQNTGALGGGMSFSIRGANSMSGDNQPLIVIDGYPVESGQVNVMLGAESSFPADVPGVNALSMLNPNDIESIEILKDASSTAIYGSRGANGVVLVTTKRGKEGREKIEYSFRTDISYLPNKLDVLSTPDYLAYSNEAYMDRADGSLAFSLDRINEYIVINTNWQDLIFQTGFSQNHQLGFTGGDKKMQYALSFGYLGQTGIVKKTSYDRGTFKLNLDREVNVRFKFGFNLGGSMSVNNSVNQSSRTNDVGASVVNAALRVPPIYNDYNEKDEIYEISGTTNPLILITKASDQMKLSYVRVAGFANYKLTNSLMFRTRFGINNSISERNYYMPRGTYLGDLREGYAYNGNVNKFDYLSEFTLNYNKTINKKHRVNAVGGYTWQSWTNNSVGISAAGFPNDNFTYYNLNSASSVDKPVNLKQLWSLASFLGRINYVYDKRYLSTVTMRYDGSSRLAPGNKWDLFPSLAFGWNIHNERFMRTQDVISELKLRASYGLSGNQTVGVGSTLSQYGITTGVINEQLSTVYYPLNMGNSLLKWETTAQTNAGIDIALLDSRITFSVDAYRKLTSDLLINLPIPESTGYSTYTSNTGYVENKGIELSIVAFPFSGKFNWKIQGNISFNQNKILRLDGEMTSFSGPNFGSVASQPLHIAMVGSPIGAFYGYKIDGIYQTQEEINQGPVDPANPQPGGFKFVDINGPDGVPDGLISDYDRTIIGNPYPDYIFGVNNDFTWKNFSLNVFIQGSIGQDVINSNRFQLDALSRSTNTNVSRIAYENRWTGPGTSNKYPAATSNSTAFQGRFSDFIVEDASYVRLKNLTLAYDIPTKNFKKINNCRVFITASNLFTISNYSGYDPEINSRGQNSMTPGVDGGSIPQFRSISAGFNVGL